jgi:hypothetical protein
MNDMSKEGSPTTSMPYLIWALEHDLSQNRGQIPPKVGNTLHM